MVNRIIDQKPNYKQVHVLNRNHDPPASISEGVGFLQIWKNSHAGKWLKPDVGGMS